MSNSSRFTYVWKVYNIWVGHLLTSSLGHNSSFPPRPVAEIRLMVQGWDVYIVVTNQISTILLWNLHHRNIIWYFILCFVNVQYIYIYIYICKLEILLKNGISCSTREINFIFPSIRVYYSVYFKNINTDNRNWELIFTLDCWNDI